MKNNVKVLSFIFAVCLVSCSTLFLFNNHVFAGGEVGGSYGQGNAALKGCNNYCKYRDPSSIWARPNTCTGAGWYKIPSRGEKKIIIPSAPWTSWRTSWEIPTIPYYWYGNTDFIKKTEITGCSNTDFVLIHSMTDPLGNTADPYSNGYSLLCTAGADDGPHIMGPMGTTALGHGPHNWFTACRFKYGTKEGWECSKDSFHSGGPMTGYTVTGHKWERVSWDYAQQQFEKLYEASQGGANISLNVKIFSSNLRDPRHGAIRYFCYDEEPKYEKATSCYRKKNSKNYYFSSGAKGNRFFGNTTASVLAGGAGERTGKYDTVSTSETANGSRVATYYAKPGDNVFFYHTLCAQAQKVKHNGRNGGSALSQRHDRASEQNSFYVSAKIDPNYTSYGHPSSSAVSAPNYVFHNTRRLLANQFTNVNGCGGTKLNGDCTVKLFGSNGLFQNSPETWFFTSEDGYGFRASSPSKKSGNTEYACPSASSNPYQPRSYFQVPGSSPDKPCQHNSATLGIQNTNVGTAISQTLTYNNVEHFICKYREAKNPNKNLSITNYDEAFALEGRALRREIFFGERTSAGVKYPLCSGGNDSISKTGKVIIPYNFDTSISAPNLSQKELVYTGEKLHISSNTKVEKRTNPDVHSKNGRAIAYSTHTPKNTTSKLVSFWMSPEQSASGVELSGGVAKLGAHAGTRQIVGFFANKNYRKIIDGSSIASKSGFITADGSSSIESDIHIPDHLPIGTKFCVAAATWPADSHSVPSSSLLSGANNNGGGSETRIQSNPYWRISDARCRTIAKKPNFQVWGGGTYTDGKITTALSRRRVIGGGERIFGSWDEHEVLAGGEVKGFASGAALGYGDLKSAFKNIFNDFYAIFSVKQGGLHVKDPNNPASVNNPEFCKHLSPLSIANNNNKLCPKEGAGNSGVPSLAENIKTLAVQLRNRYVPAPDPNKIARGNVTINLADISDCNSSYVTCRNGARFIFVDGNATLRGHTLTTLDDRNNTVSIYATGDITIASNIAYRDGKYGVLVSHGEYRNLSQIPQLLIFAKKDIKIHAPVTQVDAWLITEKGSVDTCLQYIAPNTINNFKYGTDTGVCNQHIMFNGPVIAKELKLNRNAGAEPGGGIEPAEVFNLRPDAYLWSYNQSQLYSQANTTYLKELAPRY